MPVSQIRNPELVTLLSADLQARYEPNFAWGNALSAFSMLPGLRGFWPMSSVLGGNAYDLSGQGRTLTGSNTVYSGDGLAPRVSIDSGLPAYLARADEAGLDISGTETDIDPNYQGLTLGGWFYFSSVGTDAGLMSKYVAAGNQRAYLLRKTAGDVISMVVSGDGLNTVTAGTTVVAVDTWYFLAGRFTPSAEVAAFVNGVKVINAVGVPASLFNSNAAFEIGRYDAANYFDGNASLCFLAATSLPDVLIGQLYEQTRALFGV